MVTNKFQLIFFTSLLVYTVVEVDSTILAKLRNLECFANPDWVNMTCSLRAVSWKKTLINIEAELKQDIKSVMIHAQLFRRYNSYQPVPLKVDFEFCSLIRGSGNNFFVPFVRNIFTKYTNLNHTCPYNKGDKIIAKDLDWQPSELMNVSLPVEAGRFRLNINMFANGAKARAALIISYADITEE